ncbi:MAG: RNA polymerase sigma factor [Christensenellaceae bacterium]|nr:RNA polymerase sigma factor [Christensenellaceae bacterium]
MDAQTFQREAMKHERLLYRISYAMLHSDADCADAVQEALLRAWQHRNELRNMAYFRSWLCRILMNACNDILRRRAKLTLVPLEEATDIGIRERDTLALRQALEKLPPEQNACIVMHYLEGWPVADIAAMMGVPEGTVKTRLLYGRNRLSRLLGEEWEEVEA